jgi:hypothetical protein
VRVSHFGIAQKGNSRSRWRVGGPEATVDTEMARLVDASRKMKLIENLRERARTSWTREFERELRILADEAHLSRHKP